MEQHPNHQPETLREIIIALFIALTLFLQGRRDELALTAKPGDRALARLDRTLKLARIYARVLGIQMPTGPVPQPNEATPRPAPEAHAAQRPATAFPLRRPTLALATQAAQAIRHLTPLPAPAQTARL